MKRNLKFGLWLLGGWSLFAGVSCQKAELQEPEIKQPVYFVNATFNENVEVLLEAGANDIEGYPYGGVSPGFSYFGFTLSPVPFIADKLVDFQFAFLGVGGTAALPASSLLQERDYPIMGLNDTACPLPHEGVYVQYNFPGGVAPPVNYVSNQTDQEGSFFRVKSITEVERGGILFLDVLGEFHCKMVDYHDPLGPVKPFWGTTRLLIRDNFE